MSKRIMYIPNEEDLYDIQMVAGNAVLYRYILAKEREKQLTERISKNNDLYLIRPNVVDVTSFNGSLNSYNKEDIDSFLKLLENKNNKSLYNLNCLSLASREVLNDEIVIKKVIDLLDNHLSDTNIFYRFIYKENELLDAIFGVDYEKFMSLSGDYKDKLIKIDPTYFIKFPENHDLCWTQREIQMFKLVNAIDTYAMRYGMDKSVGREYQNRDILSNPDENVKRLIRKLNNNK